MRRIAAGTIAAKRHLSLARVLAQSFRQYHPEIPFFVLLADDIEDHFDPAQEPFEIVRLSVLKIPDLPRFCFQYRQPELTYAATPYLLAHLLERDFDGACFFKQESLVLDELTPIFERLSQHSILLTPHLLEPLTDEGRHERELNVLQSGVYNVGFLGVRNTETTQTFLSWWRERLYRHCRHDISRGMHYEQRWLDLVPSFFEDVHLVCNRGFNIGHWNLPERRLQSHANKLTVDGEVCRFFRFSGFNPDEPLAVTRYSSRVRMADLGPAAHIFARYHQLLSAARYGETKTWRYAYDYFDNGVPIPDVARELYHGLGDDVGRFGDPFATTAADSFFRWLTQSPATGAGAPDRLPRLWRAIYERRPDVRSAYPDPSGSDRDGFRAWIRNSAPSEHGIPAELLMGDAANE